MKNLSKIFHEFERLTIIEIKIYTALTYEARSIKNNTFKYFQRTFYVDIDLVLTQQWPLCSVCLKVSPQQERLYFQRGVIMSVG